MSQSTDNACPVCGANPFEDCRCPLGAAPPSQAVIAETITTIAKRFNDDLFALSEDALAAQWYFTWDAKAPPAWNVYQFNDMLDLHKHRCRRWEEHHHGSMCVVERVRDKYLMPRIKAFLEDLKRLP